VSWALQCCRWHLTGGAPFTFCCDQDAFSLAGPPLAPSPTGPPFAPSPTLRTYEQGVADGRAAAAAEARSEIEALTRQLDAPPYVDCTCPGCPRKVPQRWASGMCQACATEDCDHEEGDDSPGLEAYEQSLRELLSLARRGAQEWPDDPKQMRARIHRAEALLERAQPKTSKAAEVNHDQRDDETVAQATPETIEAVGELTRGLPRTNDVIGLDLALPGSEAGILCLGLSSRPLVVIPPGVTPAELREAGFPDVAARLEGGSRG
jgi:hypothetical protein